MRFLSLFGLSLVAALGPAWAAQPATQFSSNGDPQLGDYLSTALDQNPGVRAAFSRYRAAVQRLPQVSALPDPMLDFTKKFGSEAMMATMETTMLAVSQTLPWFGKLSDSEKVAAKEAAVVRELYETREAEIVLQVKTAYYDLAYIDRATAITGEDRGLLEQYEKLAEARYAQGLAPQQGVIKIQTEITEIVNRLAGLSSQRVDAEATLNALLNRPPGSPVAGIALAARPKVTVEPARLQGIAEARRPELLAALLQVERDEKRIDLARRQYWPDFTLGGGFGRMGEQPAGAANMGSTNVYTVSVGLSLPVHRGKYDAAVFEATEDKQASAEGYRNLLNSVNASVRSTGFRLKTLEDQMSLFETTLLPQSELAMRSTLAAYSTGTAGVLDVLDSQRVLLNVRLGLARLVTDYMKSLAEMERAIGAPFPEEKP